MIAIHEQRNLKSSYIS